jgi:hypothetical protein
MNRFLIFITIINLAFFIYGGKFINGLATLTGALVLYLQANVKEDSDE